MTARTTPVRRSFSGGGRVLVVLIPVIALSGCVRGCTSSRPPIHLNPSMDDQPKVLPQTASPFFFNGASMRAPVPGTVPIGGLKEDTAFFTGKDAEGQFVSTIPVTVDEALRARGQERYDIYCQPCHDARGDGKGILFQRGNVPTASFHQEKILKYADGQIFGVITNGFGLMAGYRWPIPPADRWAIVAYVRELQRERLARATGATTPPPPRSGFGEVSSAVAPSAPARPRRSSRAIPTASAGGPERAGQTRAKAEGSR